MKTFSKLATGLLTAKVGEKTTVINTGDTTIFVIDEAAHLALQSLSPTEQQEVLATHYSLQPRQHLDLTAGIYFVDFRFDNLNAKAVLLTSVNQKLKTVKPGTAPTAS